MKLIWIQLNGFKKFSEPSRMNMDSKVIAILGKNEAGKTSFLEGLAHLNSEEKFIESGIDQEFTRGESFNSNDKIIEAGFLLEKDDIKLLEQINDGEKVRWIYVIKHKDGNIRYSINPWPKRNLQPRKKLHRKLASTKRALSLTLFKNGIIEETTDIVLELVKLLDSEDESLSQETLDQFVKFKSQLESLTNATENSKLSDLIKGFEDFLAAESTDEPVEQIIEILESRIPKMLRFIEEDRDLQHSYDLLAEGAVPRALQNIALLANLDLSLLKHTISTDDQALIETLVNRANLGLKVIFEENWSQSGVHVHFRINGRILHIQIEEANSSFTSIAERSDGLRYYVALLAFVSRIDATKVKPILLIDEAETHLHYDAQADLVQMFAKQELASKVVFTTHSIGCLPEDLGTGVRIIEPTKNDPYRSTVKNWFWVSNEPGFSPLLFGMGAQTLAFIPVRKAVVAEGPVDFILLPTLLREANNLSYVGFQVVPGLSIISSENVPLIDNGAAKVAYLVDADGGGDAIIKKLHQAGIPDARILQLPKIQDNDTVLEDFIDHSVYLKAVNEILTVRYGNEVKITKEELPETGRPTFVNNWCKGKNLETPGRREVAYRVLEQMPTKNIVSKTSKNNLVALYKKITSVLEITN